MLWQFSAPDSSQRDVHPTHTKGLHNISRGSTGAGEITGKMYLCPVRCTQGVSKDKNNQTSTNLLPVMETMVMGKIACVQIAK